jgi:hypothetical protein
MRTNRDDIKARFAALERAKLCEWDRQHPEAQAPALTTVLREVRLGHARANVRALKRALADSGDDDGAYRRVGFCEVITTPSLAAYFAATKMRKTTRKRYEEQLEEAKNAYLDRVLFDHENAFLLILDFKKWHPRMRTFSVVKKTERTAA